MAASSDRARSARALWRELVHAQAVALPLVHKALYRQHGLSLTEAVVLLELASAPRGLATMSDLQLASDLSAAGMTRVAVGLEQRRLVSRSRRDGDRRLLHVELTPEGRAAALAAEATVDALVLELLGETSTEVDVAVATRVLAALTKAAPS